MDPLVLALVVGLVVAFLAFMTGLILLMMFGTIVSVIYEYIRERLHA